MELNLFIAVDDNHQGQHPLHRAQPSLPFIFARFLRLRRRYCVHHHVLSPSIESLQKRHDSNISYSRQLLTFLQTFPLTN